MTLTTFDDLGLSKNIVATLTTLGFTTPTPIQEKGIPVVLGGRDLIGLAQTGTGKTAAFGLPMIEMLLKDEKRPDNRTTRALILAPTRELVNQIGDNLRSYLRRLANMLDDQPYLLGEVPCIADLAAYHPLWFTRTLNPGMSSILDAAPDVLE